MSCDARSPRSDALLFRSGMNEKLTYADREIFARKEASRQRDRQVVAEGKASLKALNRANAIASTIISEFRPAKKLGLPR